MLKAYVTFSSPDGHKVKLTLPMKNSDYIDKLIDLDNESNEVGINIDNIVVNYNTNGWADEVHFYGYDLSDQDMNTVTELNEFFILANKDIKVEESFIGGKLAYDFSLLDLMHGYDSIIVDSEDSVFDQGLDLIANEAKVDSEALSEISEYFDREAVISKAVAWFRLVETRIGYVSEHL